MSAGKVTLARVYDEGWRIALLGEPARKYTPVVVMESSGISVRKVPNAQAKCALPIPEYPVRRAVRRFKSAGRTFGMTEAAREFLKQAEASLVSVLDTTAPSMARTSHKNMR